MRQRRPDYDAYRANQARAQESIVAAPEQELADDYERNDHG
jgi:hypothetical protein